MLAGKEMPENWHERLDDLWKKLLFNQFHDIAPGTSIARVHEQAEEELREVLEGCTQLNMEMYAQDNGAPLWAYNWLSSPIPFRGGQIPAQGAVPVLDNPNVTRASATLCDKGWVLENKHLRCVINENGELVSVKRPGCDTEYMAGKGNRFLMFKDVNTCYDAWEIGSMYEKMPVKLDKKPEIYAEDHPWSAVLTIKKQLHDSVLEQSVILNPDEDRLIFANTIQWNEKHKMLKVAFPVNAYTNEAIHETQFGFVKRPVHRSYQTDKDRYEVCNHRYTALTDGAHGAAVLNDGKYGVNVVENEIRLTLLRSAMMPDQNADRGTQEFTYAFYPFDGAFQDSDVVQQAATLNQGVFFSSVADDLGPIFLSDKKNIIVDTIKPADTVENALLVRVYEAMGKQTTCAFTAHENIKTIIETDMLEENPQNVDLSHVHFGPFEIKTFILYL